VYLLHLHNSQLLRCGVLVSRLCLLQGFSPSRALPTEPDALRLMSALLAANRGETGTAAAAAAAAG
jgi:hypothetical protein